MTKTLPDDIITPWKFRTFHTKSCLVTMSLKAQDHIKRTNKPDFVLLKTKIVFWGLYRL